MKNKIKKITIGSSLITASFLITGCGINEANTNLKPKKIVKPIKVFKKDYAINKIKSVSSTDKMNEKTITKIQKSKKDKIRYQLSKEKVVNYLAFKKSIDDSLNNERITIDFKNTDIQEAFDLIAEASNMNILLGKGVKGNITAKMIDVPWNVALDNILKIQGYVKSINGNTIRIDLPASLLKLEKFDKDRMFAFKEMSNLQRSIAPLELEVFKLFYLEPKEVVKLIKDMVTEVKGAKEKRLKISVNDRTRSLIVEATHYNLEKIAKIIKNLDVPTEQVLIEAFIVEGTSSFKESLGVSLGLNVTDKNTLAGIGQSAISTATNPGIGNINILQNIGSSTLNASLNALQDDGISKTLANPKFYTMNHEKAIMKQGSQIPYVTATADSVSTLFKDAVLSLEATPNVIGDGNIMLEIKVTKDKPEQLELVAEPGISKMEINTKLLIKEGDIAMIGGVYEEDKTDSISKVPILGDIPILGYLFQNTLTNKSKKELLVFITAKTL